MSSASEHTEELASGAVVLRGFALPKQVQLLAALNKVVDKENPTFRLMECQQG